MEHKVKLHLYLVLYSWDDVPHYITSESENLETQCNESYTYEYIRPLEFVVPKLSNPAEIDPVQFRLRGIRKAQQHLMAEYQKKLTELKGIEQSLLALPLENVN